MKAKITKREAKERFGKIFMLSNGSNLFDGVEDAFAYSTRVEGWACDYWDFEAWIFCSGYSPIGERVDPKMERECIDKLRINSQRYHLSYNRRKAIARMILRGFVNKVVNNTK